MDVLVNDIISYALAVAHLPARAASLLPMLLDASLKGAVLLAGAALAAHTLRRASAAARHLVWAAAFGGTLVLPLLARSLPAWRLPLLPAIDAAAEPAAPVAAPVMTAPAVATAAATSAAVAVGGSADVRASTPAPPRAPAAPRRVRVRPWAAAGTPVSAPADVAASTAPVVVGGWNTDVTPVAVAVAGAGPDLAPPAAVSSGVSSGGGARGALRGRVSLFLVWLVGFALVVLRLAMGTARVQHLARRAVPVTDPAWTVLAQRLAHRIGIRRPVTLLRSGDACIPMTWGVVYPVVMLPAEADGWPAERRTIVLLHELAHVKRLDALTQAVTRVVTALYWFNPLVWLGARQMRAERERACDNYVLTAGTRASDYARDLLDIVRTLGVERAPSFATLAMARRSEFEGRLLAILDPRAARGAVGRAGAALAAVTALCLLLPLAAMRPFAAPDATNPDGARRAGGAGGVAGVSGLTRLDGSVTRTRGRVRGGPPPMNDVTAPAADSRHQTAAAGSVPPRAAATARAPDAAGARTPTDGFKSAMAGIWQQVFAREDTLPPARPVASTAPAAPAAPAPPAAATAPGSAAPAALSAAPPSVASTAGPGSARGCSWDGRRFSGNWTQSNGSETKISIGDGHRCVRILMRGTVELSEDERDVERMGADGYLAMEEDRGGRTRRVEIRPGDDGQLLRSYQVDGEDQPYNGEAREWLAEMLTEVARSSSSSRIIKPRVERIYARSGTRGVLEEISRLTSDGAKRVYFASLLEGRTFSPDEMRTIVRAVGGELASDGEKAALLKQLARGAGADPSLRPALIGAAETIASDGEKRGVLSTLVRSDGRETLVMAAKAASRIASDGEKAGLLMEIAERYVRDDALREAYLETAGSIASDGEKARVLRALLAKDELSDAALVEMLRVSQTIASDGEKGSVLRQVAGRYPLGDPEIRRAYLAVAGTIASDAEKRVALSAVARQRDLPKDALLDVLRLSKSIASDTEKGTILVELAGREEIQDEAVRKAFLSAAESLSSDNEYRRVMSAVMKSLPAKSRL